jgi:hypothetical protein
MPTNKRSPFPSKGYFGRKGVATKQGGAGLYLITLPSSFKKVIELDVAIQGAITAATVGSFFDWETNNIDGGTAAGTILLQFRRPDTFAVADVPSGTVLTITISVVIGV